ncbi:hypothetical protein MUK42_24290 [Musa troglodytarum]|uniref:Uncharacterized protein n=1 Tax=Musa troglodytarum TaxID=320322 RepID=A0A9E7EA84_9LILI|nr:hypothetical protein MUK42_24290 [Musa troglodytarum]
MGHYRPTGRYFQIRLTSHCLVEKMNLYSHYSMMTVGLAVPNVCLAGHLSFKEAAGILLPLGRKVVSHGLSISLRNGIHPGSMPQRLMGTDCNSLASTLIQILSWEAVEEAYLGFAAP